MNYSKAPETRHRAVEILKKLDRPKLTSETLHRVRALQVLEQICSEEARELLIEMSRGAAGAWETDEAKAALIERIKWRTSVSRLKRVKLNQRLLQFAVSDW